MPNRHFRFCPSPWAGFGQFGDPLIFSSPHFGRCLQPPPPFMGDLGYLTIYYLFIPKWKRKPRGYLTSIFYHKPSVMMNDTVYTHGLTLIIFLALSYFLLWRMYRSSAPTSDDRDLAKLPPSLIKAQVDPILLDTADSLIHGLLMSKGKSCSDQELLEAIGRRLSNYTWLENPDFLRALNYYMQTEGQRISGRSFPLSRLEEVWDKFRRLMEKERWESRNALIVHPINQNE